MKTALYPGSFDPVTLGHMDIVSRAASLFDRLFVVVFINPHKKNGWFSPDERVDMLQQACQGMPNVQILSYAGLIADFVQEQNVHVIIKGVRGVMDLENETNMARINKELTNGLETLMLPASSGVEHISSTLVREIATFHGNVDAYVPACVAQKLRNRT